MNVLFPVLIIAIGIAVLVFGKRLAVMGAAVGALLGVVLLRLLNIPLTDRAPDAAHSRPARGDRLLRRRIREGDREHRAAGHGRAGGRSDRAGLLRSL